MSIELPEWKDPFPDSGVMKAEVAGMADAVKDAILDSVPRDSVRGIYFTGAGQMPWDTPIDYVPELSETVVQILFSGDVHTNEHLRLPLAMAIRQCISNRFFERHPHSMHVPRPKIVVINDAIDRISYIELTACAVKVLYGEPYPESQHMEQLRIQKIEYALMLREAGYLEDLPHKIVDRPGHFLWDTLRSVSRHVSRVAPRFLVLAGMPMDSAWSMNRTRVVDSLCDCGHIEFAEQYAEFYLAAWQFVFSSHALSEAAHTAITSGVDVIKRGIEFAEDWRRS